MQAAAEPVRSSLYGRGSALRSVPVGMISPCAPAHHLIPVFVLSLEIPIMGGVFKETVKINLAEPILSTNHSSLDLSPT